MDILETSIELATLLETNKTVFVKTEPEVLDFTDSVLSKVIVYGANSRVELDISSSNVKSVMGLLDATIFDKELVSRVYCWNFKSLVSFCKYHTAKFVTPKNSIIDLKVIEAFLDIRKKAPETFVEVVNRATVVAQNKDWPAIYKSIHLPLTLRVLPCMESTALLNIAARRPEHPYYEIEGQRHGRLNCSKKFSKSYLPHNMGQDIKKSMKPRGELLRFATADFRFCEVVVLQWLTGDPKLKEILDSGQDLHSRIYEIITGDTCDTNTKRDVSKRMFLPVVYGFGAKGLSEHLKVPENVATQLKDRIRSTFSTAFEWVEMKQKIARDGGIVKDHFGRPRKYEPDEAYLARNLVVQGVAATVCQEKMIELWKALSDTNSKLAFSVHDGYCVVCPTKEAKNTYRIMKDTLEAESKLCPGLKMSVEIRFGISLDDMRVLWKN
jgi:hypothetical protein